MFAFLSLGLPEIIILAALGLLCVGVLVGAVVLFMVLGKKKQPPTPDEPDRGQ
jgi:hypothetical protein